MAYKAHITNSNYSKNQAENVPSALFDYSNNEPANFTFCNVADNNATGIIFDYFNCIGKVSFSSFTNNTESQIGLVYVEKQSTQHVDVINCHFYNNHCRVLFNQGYGSITVTDSYIDDTSKEVIAIGKTDKFEINFNLVQIQSCLNYPHIITDAISYSISLYCHVFIAITLSDSNH